MHRLARDDYRGITDNSIRKILRKKVEGLKSDAFPTGGERGRANSLEAPLQDYRRLSFNTPGGDYRVMYRATPKDEGGHHIDVVMAGPHENFYKAAERRAKAINPNRKIGAAMAPGSYDLDALLHPRHYDHSFQGAETFGQDPDAAPEAVHRSVGKSLDEVFGEHGKIGTPWRQAGGRRDRSTWDQGTVAEHLSREPESHEIQDVDPRILRSTQPEVTRTATEHYLSGDYERHGKLYADAHNAGNKRPVVYARQEENGTTTPLLLSGHHRAISALMSGRPLTARVIHGGWGQDR